MVLYFMCARQHVNNLRLCSFCLFNQVDEDHSGEEGGIDPLGGGASFWTDHPVVTYDANLTLSMDAPTHPVHGHSHMKSDEIQKLF